MAGEGRGKKAKKKKKGKKKPSPDYLSSLDYIKDWAFRGDSSVFSESEFLPKPNKIREFRDEKFLFELHCHSNRSDGFLSPKSLVQRAHRNGVKMLALTDHDTMEGVPEALAAAQKLGIRLIPGVEISCIFSPSTGAEGPVHLLAYYSSYGPSPHEELEKTLSTIREGRYLRARDMLKKLSKLKMPIEWDRLTKIAGDDVAPGRLHVARAMVELGYVADLKQAFSRYLYDGGPAYATGSEPSAEEVVELICRTGGVAVLAHPWALKNPLHVIRSLSDSGLHGMEVYRGDGKMAVFSELADSLGLLKIGGSDYHGRKTQLESDLGSVNVPITAMVGFLRMARPIWLSAIKDALRSFAEDPSVAKLERFWGFGDEKFKAKMALIRPNEAIKLSLSSWLAPEELESPEIEDLGQKLNCAIIREDVEFPCLT